jgi:hypothetical protein
MKTKSQFHIGQAVTAKGFVDCFKKTVEPVTGLTVVEMKYVNCESIAAYYRIKAIGKDGRGYVEAAERFFEPAETETANQAAFEASGYPRF